MILTKTSCGIIAPFDYWNLIINGLILNLSHRAWACHGRLCGFTGSGLHHLVQ